MPTKQKRRKPEPQADGWRWLTLEQAAEYCGVKVRTIRTWVETMTGMEMNEHDTIVPIDRDRLLERRQHRAGTSPGLKAN